MNCIKMERTKTEEILDEETLFRRLLDRQMFSWENESQTIGGTITAGSQLEARQTLEQLRRITTTKASQVVEKIRGRAESWNYSKYLDHTGLWEIPPLRGF